MAKFVNTGPTPMIYVERGDTLWDICEEKLFEATGRHPTDAQILKEVKRLAALNNLPQGGDLLGIGQKLNDGSSSTKPPSTPTGTVGNLFLGVLSTDDTMLYATWTDSKVDDTASYKLLWTYTTLSGVQILDGPKTQDVDKDYPAASRQVTYSIPSGATRITLKVMPVAKTEGNNGAESAKYNGKWSNEVSYTVSNPLEVPGNPTLSRDEKDKLKLTAELEGLDSDINADSIEFQLVKDETKIVETRKVSINKTVGYAAYTWSKVSTGSEYKVRCRAVKGSLYSDWSGYSQDISTAPAKPSRAPTVTATDETTVYVTWDPVAAATSYEIQYTTDKKYFDTSDKVTTKPVADGTAFYVTDMPSGEEYFFRFRAKNSGGESDWSDIVSVIIGEPPAAPTTWSSTTTAIVGETVVLHWVHNAEDGSSETRAKLQLYINESPLPEIIIENTATGDDKDLTKYYEFDTAPYTEGTKLQWKVQTMGITNEYGDWSIQRTVDIYARPTLHLSITDNNGDPVHEIKSFPINVAALPGPETQNPIGYHLSVTADSTYETVDRIGNAMVISAGDEVYSQHFDTKMDLEVTLSAGDIDLEQNIKYTVTCTVTMDSGLTAEASIAGIQVTWSETMYTPNASIGIDTDAYTTYITPYCESTYIAYRVVNHINGEYVVTNNSVYYAYGDPVEGGYTTTGERVYDGVDGDGNEILFCQFNETESVDNVFLSVYRREFDGSFTEIATGIPNNKSTTVTDPHPALDYARYRIVATSAETGAVGFYDMPGYPVGGNAVIIQWDEAWTNFEVAIDQELAQPPWSGSLLKLPYNIDVSDSHNTDVSLVEYIGRARPVSYYGTHLGEKSTWNLSIDKSDKETLYALRRLAIWMGDAYVREPSGSGYWAHVSVSFSQKHKDVTIPVTLDITRVEGGV